MEIISTKLCPDRYRSTSTGRIVKGTQAFIQKSYHNYDAKPLSEHLAWINTLNLPILPGPIEIWSEKNILQTSYREVLGQPLWKSILSHGFGHIHQKFHSLIQKLKDETERIYGKSLPPGTGLIHKDFHMGNIIESNGQLFLIDLENIDIGSYAVMRRELALNIMGDSEFQFSKNQVLIEALLADLCLDTTTFSSYFKDIERVCFHFYDYYREKSGYFEKEKELRALLVENALKLNLSKI